MLRNSKKAENTIRLSQNQENALNEHFNTWWHFFHNELNFGEAINMWLKKQKEKEELKTGINPTKKRNIMTDIIDILEYMLNEVKMVKPEYRNAYLQAISDLITAYIQ